MATTAGGGVEAKRVFIGAGCNRVVNNVSWGASGLVSFGAQNAVAVFSPKSAQILTTLPGHKASVNCTYWIPNRNFSLKAGDLDRHYLLSGDADGIIILWELSMHDGKWAQVLQVPESHKKGVTCITGFMLSKNEALVASTSSDGTINVWYLVFSSAKEGSCTMAFVDSISVGSKSMVALSMAELPGNAGQVVLAMGGLDNKVHLYCGSMSGKFVHACELKGHTDWIRSLDFSLPVSIEGRGGESLLLASSSQDKSIRIWRINSHSSPPDGTGELSLTSYIEGPILVAGPSSYQVLMESLLVGHEDWTYSVQWQPPVASSGGDISCHQPLSLLSSSMDKTMMIWQPERTTGIWMNVVTVGELSHCALGFYGGHWSPSGRSILAHGYGGTFHMWENVGSGSDDWQPQMVPSGHFAAVSDVSGARSGEYILSVSHDQTTRVFAPWKDSSQSSNPWHEIARPQVHGHDINCVSIIRGNGNHRFVSGADEKVLRVFEAPLSFLKTLNQLTSRACAYPENDQPETHILGANMSALGLSQKPIYVHAANETTNKSGSDFNTLESVPDAVPVVLTKPPVEEQLAWHTLWPETHKLYGHGNELYSLCCNRSGTLIASSCKAQSAAVAEIWLWQVGTWKAVGRLHSHNLTITQMEFSHDDNMLLAISRDRKFSVFSVKRKGSDEIDHQLLEMKEAHKRIIWACSWNPFGHEFSTGSRDNTVKIWSVLEGTLVTLLVTLPQFTSSITALSWLGLDRKMNKGMLAIGMESGLIELWMVSVQKPGVNGSPVVSTTLATRLDPFLCHVSAVNRLAWLNPCNTDNVNARQLASCGADHCVRIFEVIVDST